MVAEPGSVSGTAVPYPAGTREGDLGLVGNLTAPVPRAAAKLGLRVAGRRSRKA